jgi:hypothetical protein
VTAGRPALRAEDPAVARYEELRQEVITGAPGSGRYGVIVLVREGLAAWLAHAPAHAAAVPPAAAPPGRLVAPLVGDEVHQRLVGMLATMALASRAECRP